MNALVTVVTPAFNAEKTLHECIRSIRGQTYHNWEHIIVDDGSTDGTWCCLQRYSAEDSRIRIVGQANSGQSKARNVAICEARGKYIALLDADDQSVPKRLELQVEFLEANPDVDVVGGSIVNLSEEGEVLGVSSLPATHEDLAINIFRRNPFFTSTVMARREFFVDLYGFDETLRRVEDHDLWLRGYRSFRYHNMQIPLSYYRHRRRISWSDALHSARVIVRSVRRDNAPTLCLLQAARPLGSRVLRVLGLRKPPWYR